MLIQLLDKLEWSCNWACKILSFGAGIAVFVMMFVVVIDIFLITSGLGSLNISVGLVEVLMIGAIFGAIAYTELIDRHVTANILISKLPAKFYNLINIFNNLISFVVCALLTWQTFIYSMHVTDLQKTCLSSNLPYYPFTWIAVVGFFLLDIRYLIRIGRFLEI